MPGLTEKKRTARPRRWNRRLVNTSSFDVRRFQGEERRRVAAEMAEGAEVVAGKDADIDESRD